MAVIDTNLIRTQEGFLVEDFQDASEWTDFGSSAPGFALTDNTSSFLEGTQSLTWSSTGGSAGNTVRWNKYDAGGMDLSTFDIFSLWMEYDRFNPLDSVTLYISSDGNRVFTNFVLYTLTLSLTGTPRQDGGPINLSWDKATVSGSGGTIDWSNITNVNFLCAAGSKAINVNIDSLRIGRKTRSKVMITFDDGVESADFSQNAQAAVALSKGIPVSFFVIPNLIDGTDYLTKSQLTSLQGNGHLIAGHTDVATEGNYALAGWTPTEVLADITTQQNWLVNNGFSAGRDYFAWPGGAYFYYGQHNGASGSATLDVSTAFWTTSQFVGETLYNITDGSSGTITANTGVQITATLAGGVDNDWDATDAFRIGTTTFISAANNAGLKVARSIGGVVQQSNFVEKLQQGIIEPMAVNASSMIGSVASMTANIDKAIDEGTSILFYAHKISNGALSPAGTEITGDDFATVLNYIEAAVIAGDIDAVTMEQWYQSIAPYSTGATILTLPYTIGPNNGPLYTVTTSDTLATIESAGFFNGNAGYASLLKTNDVLMINASNGTKMYTVTVDQTARIISLSTGLTIT